MRIRVLACALLALAALTPTLAAQARQGTPPPAKPATTPAATPAAVAIGPNDIAVTVNYTGKGVVDATHRVMILLFAEPTVGPNSRPVQCCGGPVFVTKNATTVTFKEVPTKPVYILAIYDEAATGYNARSGPPANGTPVGMYMKAGTTVATPVTPGGQTPIKFSFSGAKKWGQ